MDENELKAIAGRLHAKFGKKFHNEKEALGFIMPFWMENNGISAAVLFGLAASGAGKKKPHASADGDSGKLLPISRGGARSHKKNTRVR